MDRMGFIGGSDIGPILGVDRFRTALDVYHEKVGEVLPFEGNADTKRGTVLEPHAATHYSERRHLKLWRVNEALVHPSYPFLTGRIDRRVVGEARIVEIKCPRLGAFARIKREGIDPSRIAQLQWYIGLADTRAMNGGEWIIFCADLWDALDVPVERDAKLYEMMVERGVHFWQEHVLKRVPPTDAQSEQLKVEIASAGGVSVRRDDVEFANAMSLFREAKHLSAEAEEIETQAKDQLAALLEKKPGVYMGGGARLTYFQVNGRSSFDKKALANAKPLDRIAVGVLLQPYFTSGKIPEAVIEEIGKANLDLAQFEKTGAPYMVMKPTFSEGD